MATQTMYLQITSGSAQIVFNPSIKISDEDLSIYSGWGDTPLPKYKFNDNPGVNVVITHQFPTKADGGT